MQHPTWKKLNALIGDIASHFHGRVFDSRVGDSWDPGQAVCAELYGADWSNDPQFKLDSAREDSEPAPEGAIAAAERLLAGDCEWTRAGEDDDAAAAWRDHD